MESYLIQTKNLTLAFTLLSLFTLAPLNSAVLIPGNNTNINYFGRFAYDDPSSPAFCWSGVGFEAAFTGTSIGVSLTDDQGSGSSPTMYDVWIDGIAQPKLTTDAVGPKKYTISTDLANTSHVIRMFLRNESQWNVKKFGGFYVDDGTTLLPAPSKPTRTIEFIGDSWTAGYGVEAGNCNLNTVSDVNKSWAGLTRDAFHAHGSFLAWSGRGMVHNLEDATNGGISPDAVPHYYDSIVCEATWFSGTHQWDFSKMDVNLVVICLGINDYSTNFPGSSAYITAYRILSTESGVITPMPKS